MTDRDGMPYRFTVQGVQDARAAAVILRNAGAKGKTLVELADSAAKAASQLRTAIEGLMRRPVKRKPRTLDRVTIARIGDVVPVAVDLDPLTNCDVVLEGRER